MAAVSHTIPSALCRLDHGRFMALLLASLLLCSFVFVQPVISLTSGIILNDFVQHYEPLFYNERDVLHQIKRPKRDSQSQAAADLFFRFNAHNRLFKIRLRRSARDVFAPDVYMESSSGPINYNTDNVYHGQMEDDDQSSVSAVVTSGGQLDATISTASETYYVEPSSRYFGGSNLSFPGVIYKASDVIHPQRHDGLHCASHQFYLQQFEHARKCAKSHSHTHTHTQNQNQNQSHQSYPTVIYPCQANNNIPDERRGEGGGGGGKEEGESPIDRTVYSGWRRHPHQHPHDRRKKKQRRALSVDPRKTTCMLYLQADHLFYGKMGSEEACIETMTRHVQRVNAIYKNIDFDGDGFGDNINFMIKRIKVHTEQALNDPSYRFPGNYGVEKFLEIFSEEDYNSFCLAYMFTYRDFEGGTLGLAWTGDLKNAGGVCEKNGHYRGSLKSLNTGIVTLLNYGKHVPPAVSHVTLAHEIGHNFGSPHDPENNRDCTPGGADGNYIMFARATSGDKKNNNQFSPCSLKSINGVLGSKARNENGCFTEPQSAICGNGVVELGEECDCGWEEDCTEKCCYPMRSTQVRNEKPCTLRPFQNCSPSQGPCCTDECQLRYAGKCRDDNGCRDSAYCDGSGPKCPASNNKPNKTVCNDEFVCFMGECTGSICIAYGLQSCQCLVGPADPPTKACELCCKLPGDDQPCVSSFEWNTTPYDVPDMHFKAGTPCNNYNGYCDVFQRCREVDPSGPLATLRRLLLSDESIASLKKWVVDHWYGVLFIVAAFIAIIVAVARVFGKRVRKMRRRQSRTTRTATNTNGVTTTLQTDDGQQHIVHPVAVRTKIPLKRKVREKKSDKSKKRATSTKKPSTSANLKNLAVFRKAKRSSGATGAAGGEAKHPSRPGGTSGAERGRRTRSGVPSTKEKVRSWLERENPSHKKIDSDDESRFPEEEEEEEEEEEDEEEKEEEEEEGVEESDDEAIEAEKGAEDDGECEKDDEIMMKPAIKSTSFGQLNSASNVAFHASDDRLKVDDSIHHHKKINPKMMRSISENHSNQSSGRHRFSRSISHGHEPDFRKLNRKTESHSHLLSKSELELDVKPVDQPDTSQPIEPIQQAVDPQWQPDRAPTHPPLQIQRIPKAKLPKSATDGHVSRTHQQSERIVQAGNKHKFASFQFLNFMSRRTASKPPPGAASLRDQLRRSTQKQQQQQQQQHSAKEPLAKRRRKIGLGSVRVVLKWHGVSHQSQRAGQRHSKTDDKKPDKPTKNVRKKRVIVYKNGNPTSSRVADVPKMDTVKESPPSITQLPQQQQQQQQQQHSVNITTNPLEVESCRKETTQAHSRRYSMQERAPHHRPTLMSSFSEAHPSGSAGAVPSSRRNRHSWCSPPSLVQSNLNHSLFDQIANDVQNDQARC